MVKPQPILQISCSPTIHPGSCSRLTSNSFHHRPVVWNHMVAVRSAVQPELHGTNIPHSVKTAKTVDNFKVKLKTHFYGVSFARRYVTAFESWYTLTDPAPWEALGWISLHIINPHYYYHYLYCNCENYPLSALKPRFLTLMEQYPHNIMWFPWLNWRKPTFYPVTDPNVSKCWPIATSSIQELAASNCDVTMADCSCVVSMDAFLAQRCWGQWFNEIVKDLSVPNFSESLEPWNVWQVMSWLTGQVQSARHELMVLNIM